MSIQAVAWVLEHSEAELADRLVLLAIANHADAFGLNAWPSVEQIAKEARVGRSTVFRCLPRLVKLGELDVSSGGQGPGRTNQYELASMKGSQNGTLKGSQGGTLKGSKIGTVRVQDRDLRVQDRDKKGPACEPQTVLNRSQNLARAREAQPEDPRTLTEADRQRGKEGLARLRETLGS